MQFFFKWNSSSLLVNFEWNFFNFINKMIVYFNVFRFVFSLQFSLFIYRWVAAAWLEGSCCIVHTYLWLKRAHLSETEERTLWYFSCFIVSVCAPCVDIHGSQKRCWVPWSYRWFVSRDVGTGHRPTKVAIALNLWPTYPAPISSVWCFFLL